MHFTPFDGYHVPFAMPELSPGLGLVFAIVLLSVGAEALVRGAVALARRCGLSSFFIGLAIVGFGTSTPELTASVGAALDGRDGIALGNVVGSNQLNVAVILGLTAMIRPVPMLRSVVRGEIWIAFLASFVPYLALTSDSRLLRWHGVVMLVGLVLFLVRGYRNGRRDGRESPEDAAGMRELLEDPPVVAPKAHLALPIAVLLIAVGLGLLVYGGGVLVDSSVALARSLGLSELVIGLTIVAAGTSAPELVTSLVAALRGHSDVAVGNVLGSNIFNLLCILGTTCVVRPQTVTDELVFVDVPVMIAAVLFLMPMMAAGRVSRGAGAILFFGYCGFIAWRVSTAAA